MCVYYEYLCRLFGCSFRFGWLVDWWFVGQLRCNMYPLQTLCKQIGLGVARQFRCQLLSTMIPMHSWSRQPVFAAKNSLESLFGPMDSSSCFLATQQATKAGLASLSQTTYNLPWSPKETMVRISSFEQFHHQKSETIWENPGKWVTFGFWGCLSTSLRNR